jgi:Tfp pilus assembly protein PilF
MTIRALLALVVLPLAGLRYRDRERVHRKGCAERGHGTARDPGAAVYRPAQLGGCGAQSAAWRYRCWTTRTPEAYEAFALLYTRAPARLSWPKTTSSVRSSCRSDFSRARNNYAAFLYGQERYAGGGGTAASKVVLDPLYNARPQAFLNLGLCRLQLDDAAGAEEALLRALINMQPTQHYRPVGARTAAPGRTGQPATRTSIMMQYRKRGAVSRAPSGLWLGVRLARATGDVDAESSYALAYCVTCIRKSPEYEAPLTAGSLEAPEGASGGPAKRKHESVTDQAAQEPPDSCWQVWR